MEMTHTTLGGCLFNVFASASRWLETKFGIDYEAQRQYRKLRLDRIDGQVLYIQTIMAGSFGRSNMEHLLSCKRMAENLPTIFPDLPEAQERCDRLIQKIDHQIKILSLTCN